jgi:SAM-dependent methyltransferase
MDYIIASEYVETSEKRAPWDNLAGYSRRELDRDFGMPNGEFMSLDGDGILQTAVKQYAKYGELSILDAGCGTANQLFTLVEDLTDHRGVPRNDINAVGVSDIDFSRDSEWWMPRAAVAEGDITYGIGDLQTEKLLPEQFHLIYSYEVMFHNEEPQLIVENLWNALKPGGVLYFNAGASQMMKLNPTLNQIAEDGGTIDYGEAKPPYAMRIEADNDPNFEGRDLYRIAKPE